MNPQLTIPEEYCELSEGKSYRAKPGGLILSLTLVPSRTESAVTVTVGCPGLPNLKCSLHLGDAVFFETPNEGLFEVRLWQRSYPTVIFLVSHIAPRPGLTGGYVNQDPSNASFTADEVCRIAESLKSIPLVLEQQASVTRDQLMYLETKLDEIQASSERFGRKDWLNNAIGVLTNAVVGAALSEEARRALFQAFGSALYWLAGRAIALIA